MHADVLKLRTTADVTQSYRRVSYSTVEYDNNMMGPATAPTDRDAIYNMAISTRDISSDDVHLFTERDMTRAYRRTVRFVSTIDIIGGRTIYSLVELGTGTCAGSLAL